MALLNKILNIKYRFFRILRKNRTSYPYLSGDAFAEIADFCIDSSECLNSSETVIQLQKAETIFCKSELLEDLLEKYFDTITARVIICGNSDYEFSKPLESIPASVKYFYLQNSYISDSIRIFTLPIGIENFKIGINGSPNLMRNITKTQEKFDSVLLGPFGATHGLRMAIVETFSRISGPWVVVTERLKPRKYSITSSKFKFVASVRGNGADTHRLWETLYRGSFPIVLSDSWSESLRYLNLPLIYVNEWKPEVIERIVETKLQSFESIDLDSLWMPYWERRIRE